MAHTRRPARTTSPDGKLWDLVEVGPLRAGDGEAIGGVSFAADVTERTQAEAGTAQLAAIVESTDDAVIALMLSAALAGGALGAWVTMPAERRFGPFQGIKSSAAIARMAAERLSEPR